MVQGLHWPLGQDGDRVLVVLGDDAELIAPILDGESEPGDFGSEQIAVLGLSGLDVDAQELADELEDGPPEVWLVLPRSDAAEELHLALCAAMPEDRHPPIQVFLPRPLSLADIVRELPSGREASSGEYPSRWRLFLGALFVLWIAQAPEESLSRFVLGQAGARFNEVAF